MFTKHGGQTVRTGTYWNLTSGQRVDVAESGVLPGDQKTSYLRMSGPLFIAMGPVIGLAYVILLPLIGIVTVTALIVERAAHGLFGIIAKSLSFGWRPRTAYLSGKKKRKSDKS